MGRLSRLAAASAWAYAPKPSNAVMRDALGVEVLTWLHDDPTNTTAFLGVDPNGRGVLAFKGTDDIRTAEVDARAFLGPSEFTYGGERTHSGATAAYEAVRAALFKALDAYGHLMHGLDVTGHSLGGMLATLAAFDLAGNVPVAAVTFGSPRVGNRLFRVAYEVRVPDTIRVRFADDLVPTVPDIGLAARPGLIDRYEHVGDLLHLGRDGKPEGMLRGWWRWLIEFNRQAVADLDGQALADHHIDRYRAAVRLYEINQGITP